MSGAMFSVDLDALRSLSASLLNLSDEVAAVKPPDAARVAPGSQASVVHAQVPAAVERLMAAASQRLVTMGVAARDTASTYVDTDEAAGARLRAIGGGAS